MHNTTPEAQIMGSTHMHNTTPEAQIMGSTQLRAFQHRVKGSLFMMPDMKHMAPGKMTTGYISSKHASEEQQ